MVSVLVCRYPLVGDFAVSSLSGEAMSGSIRPGCWFIIAVLLCAGCGKKNLPDPDAPGPAPALTSVGPPLTNEEYEEFGLKMEKAVSSGDKTEVDRLLRIVEL